MATARLKVARRCRIRRRIRRHSGNNPKQPSRAGDVMTQPLPGAQAVNVENELDIRGLFRALWAGKGWIVGGAVLFAAIVLVYTFFARRVERHGDHRSAYCQYVGDTIPNSSSYAIWTLKPTSPRSTSLPPWMKRIKSSSCSWPPGYPARFLAANGLQAASSGNARADAAMLDDLINNIQFMRERCGQEH